MFTSRTLQSIGVLLTVLIGAASASTQDATVQPVYCEDIPISGCCLPDSEINCNDNLLVDACEVGPWNNGYAPAYTQELRLHEPNEPWRDTRPRIAGNGAGMWIAVWRSQDDLGGTISNDYDIVYAISHDNGASWSAPLPVWSEAGNDMVNDRYPDVAVSGDVVIIVWGFEQDLLVARSIDGGANWISPEVLSASGDMGEDDLPTIVTDGTTWLVAWQSLDSLDDTLGSDFDILVSRSTDHGAHWSTPTPLNMDAAVDGTERDEAVALATDGSGNWVALWYGVDDIIPAKVEYAFSTDDGVSWTLPALMSTLAAEPHVATDGVGTWIATWRWSSGDPSSPLGEDQDIFALRSTDAGITWSAPIPVNTTASIDSRSDQKPVVGVDGAGRWWAAWESDEDLGGVLGLDTDLLYAVSWDEGDTWTHPLPLNDDAAELNDGGDGSPALVPNASGIRLVWVSQDDIHSKRVEFVHVDCNLNGVPDDCDIAGGDSLDANLNGIPDECDPDCIECCSDAQCDDLDPCTVDLCADHSCIHESVLFDLNGDGETHRRDELPELIACFHAARSDGLDTCCSAGNCLCRLDCSGDGALTLRGDLPCWLQCLNFGNCSTP